jgi:hypothetical protein
MENKQTAVDWLMEQYDKSFGPSFSLIMNDEIKKAKEMEKKQIIQSVTFGQNNHTVMYSQDLVIANDYYNETYGGNK